MLLGGTAIGQGVLLLSSPILSRLYTPAEWGTLGAFTALLFIFLPVSSLRLELAITVVDTEEEAAGVTVLSLVVLAIFVVLTSLLVLTLGDETAAWTEAPALAPLLWLLPVGLMLGGIYSVLNYWAIRRKEFSIISRSEITRPLTKAATQIGLGFLQPGPAGLVVGEVTGRLGGLVPLARQARRDLAPLLPAVDRAQLQGILRRRWRFPVFTGGGTLLGAAAGHLPPLLMAGFFGPVAAGWLALSQRVVLMPVSFLGQSVGKVYLSRAGNLAGRDAEQLRRLFLRTSLMMIALGGLPAAVLLFAGPDLFGLVFGEDWREAGNYARFLAPMFLAQFVLSPLTATLHLVRRQAVKFAWDGVRLIVVLAAFIVPDWLGMDDLVAVGFYGMGVAILYSGLYLLTLRGIGRGDVRVSTEAGDGSPDEATL